MSFHDVRFPSAISFGSTAGIERRTEIVTLVNGFEERNSPWAQSRRRYDAGIGVRSLDDLAEILSFFEARHAQLYAFRWKDWLDHKSCEPSATAQATDQVLTPGTDPAHFQLVRTYSDVANTYTRPITKPVPGSVSIAIDGLVQNEGSDFTVASANGVVSLAVTPAPTAVVTAGFEFDVPVRFDTDTIDVDLGAFEAGQIPSIPVVEVRV
ncbi:MAG: DUF2460 domain-containing protein [Pseudomonadota bacterium]